LQSDRSDKLGTCRPPQKALRRTAVEVERGRELSSWDFAICGVKRSAAGLDNARRPPGEIC